MQMSIPIHVCIRILNEFDLVILNQYFDELFLLQVCLCRSSIIGMDAKKLRSATLNIIQNQSKNSMACKFL